jgi:hypothetical protein
MLSVIMLLLLFIIIIMLNEIMLSVVMLNVFLLSVIWLNVIMHMLSVILLNNGYAYAECHSVECGCAYA